jgi:integrase/recombinase XerD
MVAKLSTTINKIESLPNSSNIKIINEFLIYMKSNGSSERHQNNNLNVMIEFAKYLDCDTTFYNINKKEMIISFLDTKIKIVTMTQIYAGLC